MVRRGDPRRFRHTPISRVCAVAFVCGWAASVPPGCVAAKETDPGSGPAVADPSASPGTIDDIVARLESRRGESASPRPDAPPPPGVDAASVARLSETDRQSGSTAMMTLRDALDAVRTPLSTTRELPVAEEARLEALQLYARGRQKLLSGQPASALVDLQEAARLDPGAAEVWRDIGGAQGELGRRSAAASAFQQAVRRGLRDARVLASLGRELVRSGRDADGASMLAHAREASPEAADPALPILIDSDLADALERLGYTGAAAELLIGVASVDDRTLGRTRLRTELAEVVRRRGDFLRRAGDAAMRLGRESDALRAYEAALGVPGTDPGALTARRVYAAVRAGLPADAALALASVVRAAGRVEPRDLPLIRYVAEQTDAGPDVASAIAALSEQPDATESRRSVSARARALALGGEAGREVLRQRLMSAPSDVRAAADLLASATTPAERAELMRSAADAAPGLAPTLARRLIADGRDVSDVLTRLRSRADRDAASALLAGAALAELGARRDAMDVLRPYAFTNSPAGAEATAMRAEIGAASGLWQAAREAEAALAPTAYASEHARALSALQRFAAASDRMDAAVAASDTPTSDLLLAAAAAAISAGRAERASDHARRALELDPSDETTHSVVLRVLGPGAPGAEPNEAASVVRRIAEASPSSRALRWTNAEELLQRRLWGQAESVLVGLAEEDATTPGLVPRLVQVWTAPGAGGQPDASALQRARAWLTPRLQASPESPVFADAMARVLAAEGDAPAALAVITPLLERWPLPELAGTREVITASVAKDQDAAVRLALARLDASDRGIEDTIEFCDLLLTGDRASEIPAVLREGLPDDVPLTDAQKAALTALAVQSLQRDESVPTGPRLALGVMDIIESRGVEMTEPLHRAKLVALCEPGTDAGRLTEAVRRANAWAGDNDDELFFRALDTVYRSSSPRRTIPLIRTIIAEGFASDELLRLYFQVVAELGEPQDARDFAALAERPDLVDRFTGRIGLDRAGFDDSPKARVTEMLYQLANLSSLERRPFAQAVYREVLARDPRHGMASNNLGYQLLEDGGDLAEIDRLLTVAVTEEPESPDALDSMGWLRYQQGIMADVVSENGAVVKRGAVWYLQEAKRFDERDAPIEDRLPQAVLRDHLGDALWRAGRTDEARTAWREAASLAQRTLAGISPEVLRSGNRVVADLQAVQTGSLLKAEAEQPRIAPTAAETLAGEGGADGRP